MRKITVTLNILATPAQIAKKYGVTVAEVKKRLAKGIAIEHEHSKNKKVAEKIAVDHLLESFSYYNKMSK